MADFFIGEALQGKGNELAHVDLMIGDKDGPVGIAFANGMTQLSKGHTPVLALIKPNLQPHPRTLIVPKVTLDNLEQAGKILGVNDSRVRHLILAGRLPAKKFGGVWMIQRKDLKLVAHRKPGRPPMKKRGELK